MVEIIRSVTKVLENQITKIFNHFTTKSLKSEGRNLKGSNYELDRKTQYGLFDHIFSFRR